MKTILCVSFVLFTSLSYGQDGWIECENMDSGAIPHALAISIRHMEISIDGVASETFWGNAQAYPIEISLKDQAPADANDFSGSFKLAWNSAFLFAYVEITDDSLVTYDIRSDCKTWQNDCVEFFINPDGKTNGSCPDKQDLDDGSEIHANPGDDDIIQNSLAGLGYHNTVAPIPEYQYRSIETSNGFTMEVQIPWYMVSATFDTLLKSELPRKTITFGLDVNYCDADDAGATCKNLREHILSWSSDRTTNFKNTSRYGFIILDDSSIDEDITSINNVQEVNKITQSGSELIIESSKRFDSIDVFNINGEMVRSKTNINQSYARINKSILNSGIYLIHVVYNDQSTKSFKYLID